MRAASQTFLLPYRDRSEIRKAKAQRKAMTGKDQGEVNRGTLHCCLGKKNLADRLRARSSGHGSRVGFFYQIKNLLDGGTNPTCPSLKRSYCVAEMSNSGRVEVLELLLMRGTSFHLFQAGVWLTRAATAGNERLVEAFLDCRASPDLKDGDGHSATSLASTGTTPI